MTTNPATAPRPLELLSLPPELRNEIWSYLLPNRKEIRVCEGWSETAHKNYSAHPDQYSARVQYRYEDESCHTAILRVNRQVYKEASYVMYDRVFWIEISEHGYSFLKNYRVKPAYLQNFPFAKAQKIFFLVEVPLSVHFLGDDLKPTSELEASFRVELCSANSLFQVRKNLSAITYQMAGFSLMDITIYFFVYRNLMWPTGSRGDMIQYAELPISDLEMLLQPFRLMKSIKDPEILISPTSTTNYRGFKTGGQVNTHPEVLKLVQSCRAAMSNPGYRDTGDFERFRWTTWHFEQRWENCKALPPDQEYGWDGV